MKNCDKCKFSHYTGGQVGYAEKNKVPVEWLPYKYCSKIHTYTPKNATCVEFQPITEQKHERETTNQIEGISESK